MQYPLSSGSSPNILESSKDQEVVVDLTNNKLEEVVLDQDQMKKVQNHDNKPRAMSRSAMVKAVCSDLDKENEHILIAEKYQEKPVKHVCMVDKPQIFPAASSMTTRAVIETSSANSSAEYPAPNHPKGINRMTRKFFFFFFFFASLTSGTYSLCCEMFYEGVFLILLICLMS